MVERYFEKKMNEWNWWNVSLVDIGWWHDACYDKATAIIIH